MIKHALSLAMAWRSLFCCWLVGLLAACLPTSTPTPTPTPLPSTNEGIAVVTYITGNVTLLDTGSAVKAFQVLKDGSRLQVAADAKVTVICFQERWFAVDQPSEVDVTQQCATAALLPANTAQLVKPDGGRLVLLEGSLALEEQARGERESDYGNIPIILSPRNTSLLGVPPTITWVEVSGALEYQLNLSGLNSFDDVILAAETVTCVEESRSAPNRVCATSWPVAWALEPGQRYFLTVSTRTGIASPVRESETSALRTLTADETEQIQTDINSVKALPPDSVTRNLLLAGLYREHGLLDAAIRAYEDVLTKQSTPEVAVTLGDIYLAVDLQRFAFFAYQNALNSLDGEGQSEQGVRAAAEFGIGLVYFTRQNFVEAKNHLTIAVELYTYLGQETALRNAQIALEEATKRLP